MCKNLITKTVKQIKVQSTIILRYNYDNIDLRQQKLKVKMFNRKAEKTYPFPRVIISCDRLNKLVVPQFKLLTRSHDIPIHWKQVKVVIRNSLIRDYKLTFSSIHKIVALILRNLQ